MIELWTDGACSGNPGPGGWAFVLVALRDGREVKRLERSGAFGNTTNNRMELRAVIEGLRTLTRPTAVTVLADSSYIVDAYRLGWVDRWRANGWRKRPKSRTQIKNPDLWQALDALVAQHAVEWVQVRGHAGIPINERCDVLAVAAIRTLAQPVS